MVLFETHSANKDVCISRIMYSDVKSYHYTPFKSLELDLLNVFKRCPLCSPRLHLL